MTDSWCSPVWDGSQTLSGAAAREFRLGRAGGVEAVIRKASAKAADIATREALETINGTIKAVLDPKVNVIPLQTRLRRSKRGTSSEKAREKK